MATGAIFPTVSHGAGMYESFYLRAVSPVHPVGVWIRYTVHKRAGADPSGSLWFTLFDARAGRPYQHKLTTAELGVPANGWIAVGDAVMGEDGAEGSCGDASWSLRVASHEPELRHLSPGWLYRTPLPRTKLTTPAPAAMFDGLVELAGREAIRLEGWNGMVGHNWGSEHAERWIWLHGTGFEGRPGAWLDVALGRVRLAGRMTPWLANGALSLDGRRHRIGGMGARRLTVAEDVEGARMSLHGERGLEIAARVEVPSDSAAGWRYVDPDGGEHDVVNCSVARLGLTVTLPGEPQPLMLETSCGGAYELGMREHDHGVPIAPFPDG
jgi:hypothetical protein